MPTTRTVALLTLVTVAACAKKEAARAGAYNASAAAAANMTPPVDTLKPAAPALSDANIVFILDQANVSDSARGKLAESKGTSADVKSFGKLMVGEHHALREQGLVLAKKLSVTPQAPAADQSEMQAKQEMDSLTALVKGAAWDKAYIAYEVGYHQAVLDIATKAAAAAQSAELKALIQQAAPVIQKHLDRAKEIQAKQGA